MVFRMATFDPSDNNPPIFPSSSPHSPSSITTCIPLIDCSCTTTIVHRVATGFSQLWTHHGLEVSLQGQEQEKSSLQLRPPPVDIDLKFPDQRPLVVFTSKELQRATSNFNEKFLVAEGGSAKVYKGRLFAGQTAAIKRMKDQYYLGRAFRAEVQVGKIVMHRNLVPLIGFHDKLEKSGEGSLVYPFMPNGSLADHLTRHPDSQPQLNWDTRMRIALGVARGLCYLHDGCHLQIIHRDIKPGNIMLDECFEAHIGDFGLARFISRNSQKPNNAANVSCQLQNEIEITGDLEFSTFRVEGTPGYMAPESIMDGHFSAKTDVFAFGVTLLQLINCYRIDLRSYIGSTCGRIKKNSGDLFQKLLHTCSLEKFIDCNHKAEVEKLIKLVLVCTQNSPAKRPSMPEIVGIIEGGSLDARWEDFLLNGHIDLYEKQLLTHFNQYETLNRYYISSSVSSNFIFGDDLESQIDPEELSGPR